LALAVGLVGSSARAQEPAGDTVNAATTQAADVALSTAIPYQGQLNTNGAPANGAHDFQFKLFDAATAGAQVGGTQAYEDLNVTNGLFSTALDFGAASFTGQARWLEISVRPGTSTGAFTTLSPRRPLLAVPYALYSLASAGGSGGNPAYGAAAGAPVNSVYADAVGNIGVNSNPPRAQLDVVDPDSAAVARFGVQGGVDARLGVASDGLATISFISQDGLLAGPGHQTGITALQYDRPNNWLSLRTGNKPRLTVYGPDSTATRIGISSDGLAQLSFISQDGTLSGGGHQSGITALQYDRAGGILSLRTANSNRLSIDPTGNIGIGTNTPSAKLDVAGTTRTDILVIDAGGDLAEPFDINGAETIEPGMVVAIDPDNPGQLRLATAAYDRTVAGVVSGAGGINPGLILQQEGSVVAGEHPVALTGRVYVYADATNGAIEPGDLLTTSATPGHAMKVTDYDRAQGAILGKAMSRLADGTGLVLVLVTLQ